MKERHAPSPETSRHVRQPDPALKRLEQWVGTWEMKGRTLDASRGARHGCRTGARHDASARRRGRRLAEPLGPAASGEEHEENVERLAPQQVEMPVGDAVPTETRVIHLQRGEATPSATSHGI
jgi:hypothetical protein